MNPHVPVQLSGVLKGTATNVALVRSLLGVYPPMDLQIFLHAKHLVTKFTLKRALPRMGPVVPHEPRRNRKRFLAHIALVRIGGRRRSRNNPRHDLPSSLCTLALLLLLLLFGVRFHMACVGTFAAKVDVALLAAELGHLRLLLLLLAGWRTLGNQSRGEASVTLRLIGTTGQVDDLLLLELPLSGLVISSAGRVPGGQGRVVEAQLRGGRVVLCLLHQQG